jgi:hypothetical protein
MLDATKSDEHVVTNANKGATQMLVIIAKRNDEVARFCYPTHPDDLPLTCAHANLQMRQGGWTVLYRMFPFVDCGKPVLWDITGDGKYA